MIASQLDISKEEVDDVIKMEASEEERKEIASKRASAAPSVGMFYLDAVISIDLAIRHAQHSIWRALKGTVPEFNISVVEEAQNVLEMYAKTKVMFVILHIDIVGSTWMSMTLPVERLATIIQTFTQEMSLIIAAYGGYVLKYVGDSVLAFFPVNLDDKHLPCVNAVNCAQSMIKIIRQGINPILNEYDYPEIAVRIGIDIGENVVVQYSWRDNSSSAQSKDAIKQPHHDVLGYTISIAAKMTTFAQSNQIVIGQFIYDTLDDAQKSTFKALQVGSDVWSYVSNITGEIYRIYASTVKK
ncbi:MAG: adenylate/guanylate cyclase domain-containing protein [Thermoproteota archaeon]|nr:adenylate/guanylate cyclase domain-containing protein [Thermoproteota archaeon]